MNNLLELPSQETHEVKFQSLVNETNNDEHAQCIRILSMYLAVYKICFGDITGEAYDNFMVKEDLDKNPNKIFEIGLMVAISTMNMITRSGN